MGENARIAQVLLPPSAESEVVRKALEEGKRDFVRWPKPEKETEQERLDRWISNYCVAIPDPCTPPIYNTIPPEVGG